MADPVDEALEAFEAYVSGQLLTDMTEILMQQIAESITGVTREQALEIARTQAAEMVTNITDGMRDRMREMIEQGLADQVGVDGLAKMLEEGLTLDANRAAALETYKEELLAQGLSPDSAEFQALVTERFEDLVSERAEVIAATEMRDAIETAEQQVATDRGATHKIWMTVADDNVCDDCAGNEAEGPIEIDQAFSSGDDAPPAHPNCHCTCTYITDTGNGELETFKEFAKEQAALTAAAREANNQEGKN